MPENSTGTMDLPAELRVLEEILLRTRQALDKVDGDLQLAIRKVSEIKAAYELEQHNRERQEAALTSEVQSLQSDLKALSDRYTWCAFRFTRTVYEKHHRVDKYKRLAKAFSEVVEENEALQTFISQLNRELTLLYQKNPKFVAEIKEQNVTLAAQVEKQQEQIANLLEQLSEANAKDETVSAVVEINDQPNQEVNQLKLDRDAKECREVMEQSELLTVELKSSQAEVIKKNNELIKTQANQIVSLTRNNASLMDLANVQEALIAKLQSRQGCLEEAQKMEKNTKIQDRDQKDQGNSSRGAFQGICSGVAKAAAKAAPYCGGLALVAGIGYFMSSRGLNCRLDCVVKGGPFAFFHRSFGLALEVKWL